MRNILGFIMIVLCCSCKNDKLKPSVIEEESIAKSFSSVEIISIVDDSLLNVRALEINDKGEGLFATSKGQLGLVFKESDWRRKPDERAHAVMSDVLDVKTDSIIPNFRSLAYAGDHVFVMSIGSPAILFRIDTSGEVYEAYKETHKKAFYDSMDFWNNQEGIAIGDPTDDCMSIIITRDSGESWTKLSCDDLPKAKEGEAAFAASDTNIAIIGDETWVATGGKASRILYSPNKGRTWEVFETQIIQGLETTGMYSLDFYDAKNGFAIGGDYTKPSDSIGNKIRTEDGGRTWTRVGEAQSPGYRSCVQYIPNSDAKSLVAVGFKGIDISHDAGDTWKHLSDEGFYTLRFLNDSVAYAAGRGRVAKLTFKQ